MVTVQRDVTSRALSQLLKAAGSEQVGPDVWLIGPDDMKDEEKEKIQAYTVEYLVRKIPMALTIDGKPMAFDFCKYQIDGKFMFAASYRPVESPLSNRKSVIAAGTQAESFVDSLGYLLLWLYQSTTAFGKKKPLPPKEVEPSEEKKPIPGPGADEKPKEEEVNPRGDEPSDILAEEPKKDRMSEEEKD